MRRLAASVVAIVALATASVVGAAPPPSDESVPDETVPSDQTIEDYLSAFTDSDSTAAEQFTVPESPAFWYARFKVAQTFASAQIGEPLEPAVVKASNGSAELCSQVQGDPCSTFADFQAIEDGRIITFTVEGNDIGPRLGPGGDPVGIGESSASIELFVSYRTVTSEAFVVAVNVQPGGVGDFSPVATYETSDGQRVESVDTFGVTDLEGESSLILLAFPATDPGGELTWSPIIDGVPATVVLPVPALLGPDGEPPSTKP